MTQNIYDECDVIDELKRIVINRTSSYLADRVMLDSDTSGTVCV